MAVKQSPELPMSLLMATTEFSRTRVVAEGGGRGVVGLQVQCRAGVEGAVLDRDAALARDLQIERGIIPAPVTRSSACPPGQAAEVANRAMRDLERPGPLAARANAMPIPDQDARLLGRAPDLQHVIPVEDDVLLQRVGLSGLDDERSRNERPMRIRARGAPRERMTIRLRRLMMVLGI